MSQSGSTPSLVTRLRELIRSCVEDPRATPEQAAQYRANQFREVLRLQPLGCASQGVMLLLGLAYFWDQGNRSLMLSASAVLTSFFVFNALLAWRWCRRPVQTKVPALAVWALTCQFAAAGLLWAVLTVHAIQVGDPAQRMATVALAGALIAVGSWMSSALPHTGVAFPLCLCLGTSLGLALFDWDRHAVLVPMLAVYGGTILGAGLMASRQFLQQQVAVQALEQQHQWIGLLLRDFELNASDWLWETDRGGRLRHVSSRLAQHMGQQPQHLQGRLLADVLAMLDVDAADPAYGMHRTLAERLAQEQAFRDLVMPVVLHGQRRWWALTARPLFDRNGCVEGWRGVGSDVTALYERDIELSRLANLDSLTGLPNRHCFQQRLNSYFADPDKVLPCTLYILDLDNFKTVNDSLGHDAGDSLLRTVAQRLQERLRPDSMLARLGGDEFALIVPGVLAPETARALGDRLQESLVQPCTILGHRIEMQASIGVAFAPADATSPQELLQQADLALYAAKAAGRRALRFFEPQMSAAVSSKLGLLAELREALRLGQFELHYQPQLNLATQTLVGFEALVRWRHPSRGLVSPAQFIPLAEDSGLIVPLGQWVQRQACRDAAQWPSHLTVAVNVSAVEFERSDVRRSIDKALRVSDLPPGRLEIEITESTLLQDSAAMLELLVALRGSGTRVALDDFGTGFSSLAYLRSFPLDKLKIDRSFVQALGNEEEDAGAAAIVRAIHGLSQALGLQTIAEGVETIEQLQALQELGCPCGQGYLFSRPMDAAQTLDYIRTQRARTAVAQVPAQPVVQQINGATGERPSPDVQRDARRIAAGRPGMPPKTSRFVSL